MTEEQNQFKVVDKRSTEYPEAKMLPAVQSPIEIISQAVQRGAGEKELEIIERMFEFDLRVKAQASKEEFFKDFAQFKEAPLELIADKINTHCNNNPYISVGKLLAIVNPALGKHGLIANFKIDDIGEGKLIKVTCILSHRLGHSIESSMSGEPDTAGAKGGVNKTMMHGRMSTVTYLMRTTFSAVVGIAAIDGQFDDDGNLGAGSTTPEYITKGQVTILDKLIKASGANLKKVLGYATDGKTIATIPAESFKEVKANLETRLTWLKEQAEKEKAPPEREPGEEG